jgi:hypothetical protein
MKQVALLAASATLCAAGTAAEPFISEMLINPPGVDDTYESVEIQAPPNFDFSQNGGYYLMIIEGDGAVAGTVDQVIPLSGWTAGSNGILLIRDDSSRVLLPVPDPVSTVVFLNFTPDIENGTQTYVVGYGDAPYPVGTDLDVNDDGVLDSPLSPGMFTVTDSFAYDDDDGIADKQYAQQLGGRNYGILQDSAGDLFTPDALYRVLDANGSPIEMGFMDVELRPGETNGPFYIQIESGGQYQQVNLDLLGIDLGTFTLNLGTPNVRQQSSNEVVNPSAYTIVFGSLVSGALSDVYTSDDQRFVVQNGSTFLITQSPVTIEFTGAASSGTATEVKFTCEAMASLVNLTQRLDMFNYATNGFVQVDERAGSVGSDQVVTVTKTADAQNYVSGDGSIKFRYRLKDDAPAFLASWRAELDQAVYTIQH